MNSNPWATPKPVSDIEIAFPANIDHLLPPMDQIPGEFKSINHPMRQVVSRWFFEGLPRTTEFHPREGISAGDALRHIKVCMSSWAPKHEHKEAGCAYLLHLFFEKVVVL